MNKLMIVAAAGAMMIPAAALADDAPTTGTGVGATVNQNAPYANKGQCQSALVRERNARRQDPTLRPGNADLSNSEYNALIGERFECQQDADGWWVHRVDH